MLLLIKQQRIFTNYSWYFILNVGSVTVGPIANHQYYHINDINCTGNESSIQQCPSNNLTNYRCTNNHDAGVFCNSECELYDFINVLVEHYDILLS